MTPAAPALPMPLMPFRPLANIQALPMQGSTPVQPVSFDALLMAQPVANAPAPISSAPVLAVVVATDVPVEATDASLPLVEQVAALPERSDVQLAVQAPTKEMKAEPAAQPVMDLPEPYVNFAEPALPSTVPQQSEFATPEAVVVAAPVVLPAAVQPAAQKSERRVDRAKLPELVEQPVKTPSTFTPRLPIVLDAKAAAPAIAFELAPLPAAAVEVSVAGIAPAPQKPFDIMAAVAPQAPADIAAQLSERVLDTARGNAWLDQIATDIIAAQDSERGLSFRLMPPQLGQLDVTIETVGEGMQLNFATQTEEATQIVAAAQPRLVEELRGQGVRVAGSEVSTGSGQHSSGGQPQRQQQPEHYEQAASFSKSTKAAASRDHGRFA